MIKDIPNGVYPTMITPYTADNRIDYNAVEKLINWYDEKGVAGIFAICQSSEIFYLSFEERLELLKFIVKNAPKDMTIVASGHTADDLETQIAEANKFIDVGIDGYVFISNRLANADEDDSVFLKNIEHVVNNIPEIGLGIYECPYPYKRLMSPEVLKVLSQTGKFRFLKDTSCNLDEIQAKLDAVKGTDFKIYNANSATLLESLKIGCAGFSGVMANFHPEFYVWLCENFDKDPELAEKIQDIVGFFSVAECQMYPVNAKYYQSLEGNKMEYLSRARDAGEFKRNRQLEIEQMYNLTQHFKKLYNI
ncbi:MAG: dihydrodipicolinate synthase family protein [Ruminococcaceae bacterium]|nr:dihydrodipicolinate synthase family protein [Oscillospiraceae bacterium]